VAFVEDLPQIGKGSELRAVGDLSLLPPDLLPGVRAVFFDAVGTLIRPEPPAPVVYAAVGRRFGSRRDAADIAVRFGEAFRREEAWDRAQGLQTSEAREFQRWRRIVGAVLDDVSDLDACFEELFAHFGRPGAWACDAEAGPTLAELAGRGLTLGVASNYDSRLRSVAAGLAALRPASHLVISSEVGWRKPAAGFFRAIEEAVGLPAGAILYVGDSRESDYEGARRAGLRAVLLDPRGEDDSADLVRVRSLSRLKTALPL
jgi:putative hydrolase of the HAD superfamily